MTRKCVLFRVLGVTLMGSGLAVDSSVYDDDLVGDRDDTIVRLQVQIKY